jgi:hypothetical protein
MLIFATISCAAERLCWLAHGVASAHGWEWRHRMMKF